MPCCHEMKKSQVYVCEVCGLELQVIKECQDCGSDADACRPDECKLVCCDKELTLKN